MGDDYKIESKKRRALEFLRTEAYSAHLEGNGLRVGSLCSSAASQILKIVESGDFDLPVRDILWAFFFKAFWLLSGNELFIIRSKFNKIPVRSDDDKTVAKLFQCYLSHLEQPLEGGGHTAGLLDDVCATDFGTTPSLETRELARHLIELSWFRTVSNWEWRDTVRRWISSDSHWLADSLSGLEERLSVQTRLTNPCKEHPKLHIKFAEEIRKIHPLAEIWLLHLENDRAAVLEKVEKLAALNTSDPFRWLQIADYWQTNLLPGQQDQNSLGDWFSRRLEMSLSFPLFVFHEKRHSKIIELQKTLLQKSSSGAANLRFEIWQLAMLHEIASLRLWDYWMWRDAVQPQSEVFLESSRWDDCNDFVPVAGIDLGVRVGAIGRRDKDRFSRYAQRRLEKIDSKLLGDLFPSIFETYPRHSYYAAEILFDVGDLVPECHWERMAHWAMAYFKQLNEQEQGAGGWHLNPFQMFSSIFPLVALNSELWKILTEGMLYLARLSVSVRDSKISGLLRDWLLWAPLEAAQKIAGELCLQGGDFSFRFFRLKFLIEVHRAREVLDESMFSNIDKNSDSWLEIELAKIVKGDSKNVEQTQLKARVRKKVLESCIQSVPEDENPNLAIGSVIGGLEDVELWKRDDQDIVEAIISAINSPNVLRERIPGLVNTLQLIAASASEELLQYIIPATSELVSNPPKGRAHSLGSGPFSTIQFSGVEESEVITDLGWLAFQLVRKLEEEKAYEIFFEWADVAIRVRSPEPLAIAFYGCLVIGRKSTELQKRAFQYCTLLFSNLYSLQDSDSRSIALSSALRYSESFVWNRNLDPSKTADDQNITADFFLNLFNRYRFSFVNSDDGRIRSATGAVMFKVNLANLLDDEGQKLLSTLRSDNRASVRFESNGGINEHLNRR